LLVHSVGNLRLGKLRTLKPTLFQFQFQLLAFNDRAGRVWLVYRCLSLTIFCSTRWRHLMLQQHHLNIRSLLGRQPIVVIQISIFQRWWKKVLPGRNLVLAFFSRFEAAMMGLDWSQFYILLKDLQILKIFYRFITVQSQYKYLS